MTDLPAITLARGSHPEQEGCADPQRCLFEWYNVLARDVHTDDCPPGVSRVLHRYGMRLNDALPDAERQQLTAYLPNGTSPLAGTADDGKDTTRGLIAADWAIRFALPRWLDAAGLSADADALRALPRISTAELARASRELITPLRAKCRESRESALERIAAAGAAVAADAVAADAVAAAAAGAAGDAVAVANADAADAVADAAVAAVAVAVAAAVAAADAAVAVAVAAVAVAVAADAVADARRRRIFGYSEAKAAARAKVDPIATQIRNSSVELYAALVTGEWPAL
jgi:hypothetical protein